MSQDTLLLGITGLWLCENSEGHWYVMSELPLNSQRRTDPSQEEHYHQVWGQRLVSAFLHFWGMKTELISNILKGKMWKRRQTRTMRGSGYPHCHHCFKQGRRRTWSSLCHFPFQSFRTFRDGSAWNSVLSTAESLEIFPRILYY